MIQHDPLSVFLFKHAVYYWIFEYAAKNKGHLVSVCYCSITHRFVWDIFKVLRKC